MGGRPAALRVHRRGKRRPGPYQGNRHVQGRAVARRLHGQDLSQCAGAGWRLLGVAIITYMLSCIIILQTHKADAEDKKRETDMSSTGLRERKKALTRQLIADTAARLFAERGYENVAVSDVAREADVAEQTVYNYFPSKKQLVTDREQQIQERLCLLIRSRPPGSTPAAAIREFVLQAVADIRNIPSELWRGELGYLAAISPTVHRLALELVARQAHALAAVLS